jgi:hypothetical protein
MAPREMQRKSGQTASTAPTEGGVGVQGGAYTAVRQSVREKSGCVAASHAVATVAVNNGRFADTFHTLV